MCLPVRQVRFRSLKLREELRARDRVMGVISMQLLMEPWVCMNSYKTKTYKRRVGQRRLVFKSQTKAEDSLKGRKKIMEDEENQGRIVSRTPKGVDNFKDK